VRNNLTKLSKMYKKQTKFRSIFFGKKMLTKELSQSALLAIEAETCRLRAFQLEADEICRLIIDTDLPLVDIEIQVEKLRVKAREMFPGKEKLFAQIYESRFQRFGNQFRDNNKEVFNE